MVVPQDIDAFLDHQNWHWQVPPVICPGWKISEVGGGPGEPELYPLTRDAMPYHVIAPGSVKLGLDSGAMDLPKLVPALSSPDSLIIVEKY